MNFQDVEKMAKTILKRDKDYPFQLVTVIGGTPKFLSFNPRKKRFVKQAIKLVVNHNNLDRYHLIYLTTARLKPKKGRWGKAITCLIISEYNKNEENKLRCLEYKRTESGKIVFTSEPMDAQVFNSNWNVFEDEGTQDGTNV